MFDKEHTEKAQLPKHDIWDQTRALSLGFCLYQKKKKPKKKESWFLLLCKSCLGTKRIFNLEFLLLLLNIILRNLSRFGTLRNCIYLIL